MIVNSQVHQGSVHWCRLADALEDNGGNEGGQDDYYDDAMDSQLLTSRGKEVRGNRDPGSWIIQLTTLCTDPMDIAVTDRMRLTCPGEL